MAGPSKLLERKWREREALLHRSKVANIKSNDTISVISKNKNKKKDNTANAKYKLNIK